MGNRYHRCPRLLLQWRRIARNFIVLSDVIERMAAGQDDAPVELPRDLRELQGLLQQACGAQIVVLLGPLIPPRSK